MAELKALIENRKEHVQYLEDVLLEAVMEEFQEMYQSVSSKPKILQEFQTELGKVPEWNHVMIGAAYDRLKKRSGCKFLPDLLRAIFTTSVKCHLMTHGKLAAMDTIRFRVPTTEKFIHRLLIACAQQIWKQPYLFYHAVRSIERQYNRGKVEDIIRKQVESTIRLCLPLEQIVSLIQDSIEEESSSSEEETDNSSEPSESEDSSVSAESESEEEEVSDVEIERIIVEDDTEDETKDDDTADEAEDETKDDDTADEAEDETKDDDTADEAEDNTDDDTEEITKDDADAQGGEADNNVDEEDVIKQEKVSDPIVAHDNEELKVVASEHEEPTQEALEEPEEAKTEERELEPDVEYFDELVKALENEPDVIVSDASPERKSIEIHTSSTSEDESDDQVQTRITDDNRKVIPLGNMLINQRKFHRPKMAARSKRTDRIADAFY